MARANPVAIMFIIARRRGQRIEIGDGIAITVTDISRNLVKLGIEAPRDCLIARGELKESVALANREAALCNMVPVDQPAFNEGLCSQGAPAEAARILAESIDFSRQAQLLARTASAPASAAP